MRILHITATHLGKHGGIPAVLIELVKNQNEIQNVESRVLSVRHPVSEIDSQYFSYEDNRNKIKKYIEVYNPMVVIFHGLYFTEYVFISSYLRNKIKYYIEPHSSFMKSSQKKGYIKKVIANNTFFKTFISNAYGYIFLNNSEKENSIFRSDNDIIIPNGVNKNKIPINKNLKDPVKLFFLGRIDINHKGLDLLLNSLSKLDTQDVNFSLHLFGTGSQSNIEELSKLINKIKGFQIKFKGPVYDFEKEEVLSTYNIMLLTSRYEGFPMTVLEALSYGIPCVVTDGTNVRDIVEKNNLGWGTDYNNLADTIIRAISDYKESPDKYIKETKEFVEKNFSWRNIAIQSIEKITDSLGGR